MTPQSTVNRPKILITGASGLVGSALITAFKDDAEVLRLVRHKPLQNGELYWNPSAETIEIPTEIELDAVVHLAGDGIANGLWTEAKKARIRKSRVQGTELLRTALANLKTPPKTFLCASAIGVYGDRGEEILTERSPRGQGFLADVGVEWEEASKGLSCRTVNLRFGIIITPRGGALKKMLLPFKLGIGGKLGSGKQWMSWIALADVISAIRFILRNDELSGPVNLVSPSPIRNVDFTKVLGNALHRPTFATVPAPILKLLLGDFAKEALLGSTRVVPERLIEAGFKFSMPELGSAVFYV